MRGSMQKRMYCVIAAVLTAATAMAQGQFRSKEPSMEVESVNLTLGTPRARVLTQIREAGLKVLDLPAQGDLARVAITTRNLDDKVQAALAAVDNKAEVHFRDGILVGIQKQIAPDSINTSRDLASAIYATIQEIEQKTDSKNCGIRTMSDPANTETPGMDGKTMLVGCSAGNGAFRTMILRWITVEELKANQFPAAVFERLAR
jgi:hypothetical protein